MVKPAKHRLISLVLVAATTVSSTGLPIIVVSCKMGKAVLTEGCASQCKKDEPAGARFSRIPCEVERTFIGRNTNALLPPKPPADSPGLKILHTLHMSHAAPKALFSLCILPTEPPPPLHDNIPIFTSALLI
jgi:hypothetical protein